MDDIFILLLIGITFFFGLRWRQRHGGMTTFQQAKHVTKSRIYAQKINDGEKPFGQPLGEAFGSAYFMTPQQIIASGIGTSDDQLHERCNDDDTGFLLLGYTTHDKDVCINILDESGHALTIAPTRSGKGVCGVIPNLLSYGGSVIVNDIKGENYAVTRTWRRVIEQNVQKFSPFDDSGSGHWNPFDMLGDDADSWEDARYMAELLIPNATGEDEFWTNGAQNLLTGLILYIHLTDEDDNRSIGQIRHLLTQDEEEFNLTLAKMATHDHRIVARTANVFLRADNKVREGFMSTLDSKLGFLDSERITNYTQKSTINFKQLKEGKASIFLIIPPERLSTYAPFIRLFMGMALLEMKRTRTKPQHPVLFLLDEFAALGRMKVIEEEITYLAGYNIRLWLFAQDLKQLASIYGDSVHSIIANCAVKQFFGVADYDTAKLVSLMCGETTIPHINYSTDSGINFKDIGVNLSSSARALVTPNEVMNIDNDYQLLFHKGQQPIFAHKINYLEFSKSFSVDGKPIYRDNPFYD